MSKEKNALQRMTKKVKDSQSGARGAKINATLFSVAAMPTVFWGTMACARDRALAGLYF